MKPKRLFDALKPVERIQRGLRVQDHPAIGVERIAPRRKQLVNIILLDTVPAHFDFDRRDIADQPAR